MNDLRLEKARLQTEIVRTEEKIKSGYRKILDAFALRNIITTVTTEFMGASSILSKIISLGRNWIGKRKKKKQKNSAPPPPEENSETVESN